MPWKLQNIKKLQSNDVITRDGYNVMVKGLAFVKLVSDVGSAAYNLRDFENTINLFEPLFSYL